MPTLTTVLLVRPYVRTLAAAVPVVLGESPSSMMLESIGRRVRSTPERIGPC